MADYATLDLTADFLESLVTQGFSPNEQKRFVRALRLLDTNEQHPSLRVHQLQGKETGIWSASASDELRITFQRLADGRKMLLRASRHTQ
jgi:mRNA-degrading endonuclease YafQ of YafQ-DinJ toxin-antitoxin module